MLVDSPTRRVNPQAFETPRQLNPALSPATEAIVLKAMGEDPQDRYQSALEMAQAIVASGVVQPNSPGLPTSGPLLGLATSQPLPAYPTTTKLGQAPGQPQGPTPPYPGQAQGPHHLSAPSPVPTFPVLSPAGRRGQASVAAPSPIVPGRSPAAPAPAPGQRRDTRRGLLGGGAAFVGAAVLGGAGFLYFTGNTPRQSPPPPPPALFPLP